MSTGIIPQSLRNPVPDACISCNTKQKGRGEASSACCDSHCITLVFSQVYKVWEPWTLNRISINDSLALELETSHLTLSRWVMQTVRPRGLKEFVLTLLLNSSPPLFMHNIKDNVASVSFQNRGSIRWCHFNLSEWKVDYNMHTALCYSLLTHVGLALIRIFPLTMQTPHFAHINSFKIVLV